jgi:hypothetical protein
MDDLLYAKSFHQSLFDVENPGDNKTTDQHTLLLRHVRGYIRQWDDDYILNHISEEKYAKSLWDKFVWMYAK